MKYKSIGRGKKCHWWYVMGWTDIDGEIGRDRGSGRSWGERHEGKGSMELGRLIVVEK